MTPDWSLAAVVAAIAIFAFPYLAREIKTMYNYYRRSRRCLRLKWQDIPDGQVHQCGHLGTVPYFSCYHTGPHHEEKECWKLTGSLVNCFNKAWNRLSIRPQYAKVIPEILPLGSQFLCTDARTVLAFILCTVDEKRSFSSWHPRSLAFDDTRVELETLDGTTVAHVRGRCRDIRKALTKIELERMLSGYPPWYREKFVTRAKHEVPFPISDEKDIPRAGWIIAVGLMDDNHKSQKPLALYRASNEPDEPAFRQNGGIFRQAVARCRNHIRDRIAPHFPGDQDVADALTALTWLIEQLTGSGMPEGELGRDSHHAARVVPNLRYSDCVFVCKNFNAFEALDANAQARLAPILFPVMAAAVHGAYAVVQYLKDDGMELKIPPELLPLDREVWLRDCVTRLPIR
ncbi:hypothetical protein HD806DRAFT_66423 [Xylariaceae sp. AK1471]|nr:hypothetical protein HD806DRAFT_66423 [Xylariaceae sp. AK1471]